MHLFYRTVFNILWVSFLFIGPIIETAFADNISNIETPESIPNKPEKNTHRNTPVSIEFEGSDSIGSKLSTTIKELMNASNLFVFAEKDTPKIRIVLSTKSEFPQRPNIGSAYTVIWLFSQSDTTLKHYLQHELGIVTAEEISQVAAKIIEQTDSIAIRYGYLFQ